MIQLINAIFVMGWYIGAGLFVLQSYKLYKSKDANGVSIIAAVGFFILNLNSSFWMYFHHEYLTIIGTMGIALANLANAILAWNYGGRPKYDAVIFDLDGTIFDTQTPVHATAECSILATHGIILEPAEISERFAGMSTLKVFKDLAPHLDEHELFDQKWNMIREMLESKHPEPIKGMDRLLAHLRLKKTLTAVASASPRWYIELMMKKNIGKRISEAVGPVFRDTPLGYYFQQNYVSADEVENPKPAPDVFLEAAKRLGVDPQRCLVIGDGMSDVRGGTAAGMDVIFLGKASEELEKLDNVISFSNSEDLVSYLIKQKNFF
ncbi:MAG: hypothetical protein JWM20_899 [Patescibacteria group bacterium]|nr:hypothetical protein [Patescibacteria group bacterium]